MKKRKEQVNMGDFIFGCIAVLAVILIYVLIIPTILWGVWNLLVVTAFGLPVITFFQSIVVCIVLSVIGSFFRSSRSSK